MRLRAERECETDVLVLGGGLAGLMAAISAADEGARVTLACAGPLFSGSSFYPGTWGLGLVGPDGEPDEADLERTILGIGRGVASPELVRVLVRGITPAREALEALGVRLRRPERAGERAYIPCFDHKHRLWRGLERSGLRGALSRALDERGVRVLPGAQAVRLAVADGRVHGAVLAGACGLFLASARATVLATGGFGGLFARHLCTPDVTGVGAGLALEAGCTLTNLEFLQVMPGYVAPPALAGVVFNEKAFRWAHLAREDGSPLAEATPELMDERSGYGPFTSRLASREVDLALAREAREGRAVHVSFDSSLASDAPEFVRTYLAWLRDERGVDPEVPARLAHFAHAANGGVRIDAWGRTDVDGLLAAGEVTGGMHGADRLGGLSSANCLVFGGRAGRAAAWEEGPVRLPGSWAVDVPAGSVPPRALGRVRDELATHALVLRTSQGLGHALGVVDDLREQLEGGASPMVDDSAGGASPTGSQTAHDTGPVVEALLFRARLACARAFLEAALGRTESRGAHFREDAPCEDPAQAHPSLVRLDAGAAVR